MSDEEEYECPLCMEELDISDHNFKPCPCGYQICTFCWNHIRQNLNGRCPACRREYSDQPVEFTPVTPADVQRFKTEKRQKERERKEMEVNNRRHLANMRVVQKNLVYVIGISARLATEELMRQNEYFGSFGKIVKIVVNKKSLGSYNEVQQNSKVEPTVGVYVTFARKEDAAKCIASIDGTVFEGRVLRASYGTTKYCSFYLRGLVCQNPGCMYLHEPGEEADSYTKEEMTQGKHHKVSGSVPVAPGSPDTSAVGGPPTPFGANVAYQLRDRDSNEPEDDKSRRMASMQPDLASEEWPAPSAAAATNGSKSSPWNTRNAGASSHSSPNSGQKSDDGIFCEIYQIINPSTAPSASVAGAHHERAAISTPKVQINTSQLHRFLFLSRQAREYYHQAIYHNMPSATNGSPSPQNVILFNPFKSATDQQDQSRFGFANQESNGADKIAELAERFNQMAPSLQAQHKPPQPTGLGMSMGQQAWY